MRFDDLDQESTWSVCLDCGVNNPVEARFCWKCGGPLRVYWHLPEAEREWEGCILRPQFAYARPEALKEAPWWTAAAHIRRIHEWRVVAQARGPRGWYIYASTPVFSGDPNGAMRALYTETWEALAQQLLRDGWEQVGPLSTFERRVFR